VVRTLTFRFRWGVRPRSNPYPTSRHTRHTPTHMATVCVHMDHHMDMLEDGANPTANAVARPQLVAAHAVFFASQLSAPANLRRGHAQRHTRGLQRRVYCGAEPEPSTNAEKAAEVSSRVSTRPPAYGSK